MKVEQLKLENFKAFRNEKFNFKKITLLTGANSSGKSTIINALASILQGTESKPFPFYFNNYGDNIHLGGFRDIIYQGNTSERFKVGLKLKDSKEEIFTEGTYRYASAGKQILVDSLEISTRSGKLEVRWKGQKSGYEVRRIVDSETREEESKMAKEVFSSLSGLFEKFEEKRTKNTDNQKLVDKFLTEISKSSNDWFKVKPAKSSMLLHELKESIAYKITIDRHQSKMNKFRAESNYIGPIRPYPARHYYIANHTEKVDALGQNAFHILVDWYKSEPKKFASIMEDLKLLELAEEISVDSIKDELIELNVTPAGESRSVNLSDVGFGLSQVLPILVTTGSAIKNSTILINQPEVHLHPSSQALLANFFTNKGESKNFIIETHSEYLINRFRLLIAQGKLSASDFQIIYLDKSSASQKVHHIDIDKSGTMINAPESFFETYYSDNKELVLSSFQED